MAILDPGYNLTLRPMKYPQFYDEYKNSWANHWMVEEVDFSQDKIDLRDKLSASHKHMVSRIVAYFATGDQVVANNLVIHLYKHVNSVEARMYYSRQLIEETVHVDFYHLLVNEYIEDEEERHAAFRAIETIPSIKQKGDFTFKWIDSLNVDRLETHEDRRKFLMILITFAAAIEGLFFMGAFAYVYYLRSLGLLPGLAAGTNWVFRDESKHMEFAFCVIDVIKKEYPELFDAQLELDIVTMLEEAIQCEMQFTKDALQFGILGFTEQQMEQFLQFCADSRLIRMGFKAKYNVKNPLDFMILQDMSSLTNFFEKRVSEYQVGVEGSVDFGEDF